MTDCVIVALPEEDSRLSDISSEDAPHLTLLYLGDLPSGTDHANLSLFVQHAVETSLRPFGLTVDHRGTLGDKEADVLFFEKDNHSIKDLETFRAQLLTNPDIARAYAEADQYPTWTPHLTLGYPDNPAKPVDEEKRHYLNWIHFDRIAVWFDDSEGPTFRLKHHTSDHPQETGDMAMADTVDNFLEHFGVKGMRWGRRKGESIPDGEVRIQAKPNGKLKAEGGKALPAHDDAIKSATAKQVAKASTINALSTKDLKELVNRMNLEQQYADLSTKESVRNQTVGQKFVSAMLGDLVKQNGKNFVQNQVKNAFDKGDTGPRREFDEQFDKARRASNKA